MGFRASPRRALGVCTLAVATCRLPWCANAETLRTSLLELAQNRINVWYADASHLEDPSHRDGVTYRLSKEDKACGGDGVPLTFLEFDIDGVRPVDAFNVIADAQHQASWDGHCSSMTPLGDMQQLQARGFAGTFAASPLSTREIYQWLVVDANFSSEEFWAVFSTLQGDELRQRKAPLHGAVQMQNCLAAYKFTKTEGGVHVVNTQQVNAHPFPLKARDIANLAWGDSVDVANELRSAAAKQGKRGWNSTRTTVPAWMLQDRPCGAAMPDTSLKQSILARAASALHPADRGREKQLPLPSGETLRLSRRDGACGGGGVRASTVPVWWTQFRVPDAAPAEVFNALVAKTSETRWNSQVQQESVTGFKGGARGVHEALEPPRVLRHAWTPRELWEWQAAGHALANDTYLIALTSVAEPTTAPFSADSVRAAQCMSAFEVAPAPEGGTLVRSTTHPNPNIGVLSELSFLWARSGEKMLVEFAASLTAEARRLAQLRGTGARLRVDGDALELLAPGPPGRNASATVATVLAADHHTWLWAFAQLNLPSVLNASTWAPGEFQPRAADVLRLFRRLELNATAEEAAAFRRGEAGDTIALQVQGEALAAIQLRALAEIARRDCHMGPGLPDIDGDKREAGLSVPLAVGAAIAALLLLASCIACCCRWWLRSRSKRTARRVAEALLESASEQGSISTSCSTSA